MSVSYPLNPLPSASLFHKTGTPTPLAQSSWFFYPPLSNSHYHHGATSLSKGQPNLVNPTYSAHPGLLANIRQPTLNMDPPPEPMDCEPPFFKKAQEKDEPMDIEEVSFMQQRASVYTITMAVKIGK